MVLLALQHVKQLLSIILVSALTALAGKLQPKLLMVSWWPTAPVSLMPPLLPVALEQAGLALKAGSLAKQLPAVAAWFAKAFPAKENVRTRPPQAVMLNVPLMQFVAATKAILVSNVRNWMAMVNVVKTTKPLILLLKRLLMPAVVVR